MLKKPRQKAPISSPVLQSPQSKFQPRLPTLSWQDFLQSLGSTPYSSSDPVCDRRLVATALLSVLTGDLRFGCSCARTFGEWKSASLPGPFDHAIYSGWCALHRGGLLRLGAIANFLSRPILVGFLNGMALIIISGQLGKLFGFAVRTDTGFFLRIADFVSKLPQTRFQL